MILSSPVLHATVTIIVGMVDGHLYFVLHFGCKDISHTESMELTNIHNSFEPSL